MSFQDQVRYITAKEYLDIEEHAAVRHEYVDGQIFTMSGVRLRHNVIATNIHSILRSHVRGSGCRAYISEVKVHVEAANSFYYPDVVVSCERYDEEAVYLRKPVLIAEVLSRSTATIDQREKVLAYRQIESLKEYLIVHQTTQRIKLHRRNGEHWDILQFGPGAQLHLESIPAGPLVIPVEAVYEDAGSSSPTNWQVREATTTQYMGVDEAFDEAFIEW